MKKISKKKQGFLICFVFIWALLELACGPEVSKDSEIPVEEPAATAAKTQDIKKAPPKSISKIKKPKKVEKPAPVFQPQATITMADGKVYEVADFAFYSRHRDFKGGMYYPKSGKLNWFLYLKQGPIWKTFDFTKVKSITISKSSRYDWLNIRVVMPDGSTLQGTHPLYSYKNTWHKHGHVYLEGKATVLGRTGDFKCKIEEVFSFERLDEGAAEESPKFKITHNKKEKIQTVITNPQFKLIWERVTPTYLDVYKLKTDMPVTVNNTKIKIKPQEMESITVHKGRNTLCTVKMKKGDTVKVQLPPRVFGKLENGDILYTYIIGITGLGRPIVKKINIK